MRLIFQRDVDGASGDVYFMRLAGLSTETKPTENVATGSIFIEVDTDKKYRYDEDSTSWTEEPAAVDPEAISEAVEDWLDDHPEATTTVVDGAITYAKLDSSLKGSVDDVSDLKNDLNGLETLTVAEDVTKEYMSSADDVDTYKHIEANGDIVTSAYAISIWQIPIDGTYQGVGFRTIRGKADYIAFYTAETYAGCNSSTFVSAIAYTNDTINEIDFPATAKMCLINYRDFNTGYLYNKETIPASDLKVRDLAQRIDEQIGTTQNFAELTTFQRGDVTSNGGINANIKYVCVNTNILTVPRTIKYSFNSQVYKVWVGYYNEENEIVYNNAALTTDDARTILAGSRVRIAIKKIGSTVTLTDGELLSLPAAVTFPTEYVDLKAQVAKESDYTALCAKMFEKGGSPKSFTQSIGIIVAGQSNIDGRVPKASLPDTITPPFANIKNSINNTTGSFASSMTLPSSFGIDFSMYAALNELGEDIYVIKRSEGGTSIGIGGTGTNKWTPWYEELDSISKSLLFTFETQIRKCIESNPDTFNIRAFVWQQGEGDWYNPANNSGNKSAALDYYKNFKAMVAYIRGVVGNERLPVICGTVPHVSGQYSPIVEEATLKVASEDPYMTCIDMSEATLLDSYHFDADSAVYFGYKAYDALIDFGVISSTKINPTPPWES